jgi:DNA-binding phage protein
MISQISNYAYPREASYNTNASAPTTGMEAQDPNALATAPTGTDSFTSASNLAPTTAPAEEPQKKGPNYLAWGALGAAVLTGGLLLGHHNLGWFKKAVEEGADDLANGAAAASKGAVDAIDNVAANTPVAKAQETVAHTLEGINFGTSSADDIAKALLNSKLAKENAETVRIASLTRGGLDQALHSSTGHDFATFEQVVKGQSLHELNPANKKAVYDTLVDSTDPLDKIRLETGTWKTNRVEALDNGKTIVHADFVPGEVYTPEQQAVRSILSHGAASNDPATVRGSVAKANGLVQYNGGSVERTLDGYKIQTSAGAYVHHIPSGSYISANPLNEANMVDEYGQTFSNAQRDAYFNLREAVEAGTATEAQIKQYQKYGSIKTLLPIGHASSPNGGGLFRIPTGATQLDTSVGF